MTYENAPARDVRRGVMTLLRMHQRTTDDGCVSAFDGLAQWLVFYIPSLHDLQPGKTKP